MQMKEDPLRQGAIFTLGHSKLATASFLQLLKDNTIQVVVDVRSAPYSRHVPQFNKHEIETVVRDAGLQYIFMGDVLGGKPANPRFLDQKNRVRYDMLAASESFQQGLDRLAKGLADGWRILLMCAEENPLKCHRHHLISRELEFERNIAVWHIRADGTRLRARDLMKSSPLQKSLF